MGTADSSGQVGYSDRIPTVLGADDDADNRRLLEVPLTCEGFDVVMAGDCNGALDLTVLESQRKRLAERAEFWGERCRVLEEADRR